MLTNKNTSPTAKEKCIFDFNGYTLLILILLVSKQRTHAMLS